jgi:transposase
MIAPPPGARVWLAAGVTDMRNGFDGLAALVQQHLGHDPFSGQLFAFRGRRGDLVKVLRVLCGRAVRPAKATTRHG